MIKGRVKDAWFALDDANVKLWIFHYTITAIFKTSRSSPLATTLRIRQRLRTQAAISMLPVIHWKQAMFSTPTVHGYVSWTDSIAFSTHYKRIFVSNYVPYMASRLLTPSFVNGSCVITLRSVFVQGIWSVGDSLSLYILWTLVITNGLGSHIDGVLMYKSNCSSSLEA